MGIRNFRVTNTMSRQRVKWGTVGVSILLIFTALFSFPQAYDKVSDGLKSKSGIDLGHFPWQTPFRLGLDLLGGTHLVYEADVAKMSSTE
ncbi:MAG: hypothetical protein AAB666_03960 [Patescibacteria group bacterium]